MARVYARSAERLTNLLAAGETDTQTDRIASNVDVSVMTLAELVWGRAKAERDPGVVSNFAENTRFGETVIEEFILNFSKAGEQFGQEPNYGVYESIQSLLE